MSAVASDDSVNWQTTKSFDQLLQVCFDMRIRDESTDITTDSLHVLQGPCQNGDATSQSINILVGQHLWVTKER
jgi:hypothetical protein